MASGGELGRLVAIGEDLYQWFQGLQLRVDEMEKRLDALEAVVGNVERGQERLARYMTGQSVAELDGARWRDVPDGQDG